MVYFWPLPSSLSLFPMSEQTNGLWSQKSSQLLYLGFQSLILTKGGQVAESPKHYSLKKDSYLLLYYVFIWKGLRWCSVPLDLLSSLLSCSSCGSVPMTLMREDSSGHESLWRWKGAGQECPPENQPPRAITMKRETSVCDVGHPGLSATFPSKELSSGQRSCLTLKWTTHGIFWTMDSCTSLSRVSEVTSKWRCELIG